jgi:hypothetical protein
MTVKEVLEEMCKNMVTAYFKILPWNLPGTMKTSVRTISIPGLGFELGVFRIKVWHSTTMSKAAMYYIVIEVT